MKRIAGLMALLAVTPVPAAGQAQRFDLDTVHVSVGSRAGRALARAVRTVEVMERAAIATLPAHDVQELLTWLTGVEVLTRSPAQADVALRGSSFEQVVIMVDGVVVSDDQTGHFDLDLGVPLESVERIEILRGAGSSLYGPDAIGGVINLVTSRGAANIRARVEAGTFNTRRIEADGGLDWTGGAVRAGAGYARSDGHREGTDYRNVLARAGADFNLANGTLALNAGFAQREFGAADFYAPYNSYEETGVLESSVGWRTADPDARFSFEPRLSFRRHTDHFILIRDNPSVYENRHTNWRAGTELVGRYALQPDLQLAAGVSADVMDLESVRLGDRQERRTAVFAELAAGRPQGLALVGGLRYDWHSAYGGFVSPSVAAGWRPAPRLQLRASADRGLRAPTWTERFYEDPANLGNPDLEAEEFWNAEIGFSFAPSARTLIDAALFLRHADELIDWVKPIGASATDPWQITNIEQATFRGMELVASTTLRTAELRLRASALSFTDEEGEGIVSKYALRPLTQSLALEMRVPLQAGLSFTGRLGTARHAGEKRYAIADARVAWRFRNLAVYLDGTNLTDEDYLDASAKPVAGRAFYLGVRVGGLGGLRNARN